ncbi:MAG: hypothetical protein JWP89_5194 [Schlesneria sp.]|nr:hypothetical protein [Schlesneria sp.]
MSTVHAIRSQVLEYARGHDFTKPTFSTMNDELSDAIELANSGKAPSPFGKIEIVIPGRPVSVQSAKPVKDEYLARIKKVLSNYQYVLTGQLILDVTWLLPAKSRYETDASVDIDNCLKPIIDAFTGPDGLFVNDCQIKGLYICWRHIESGDERLHFEFEFDADQFCCKEGLAFIRLNKGLCCPVNRTWPMAVRVAWVGAIKMGELFKSQLEKLGAPYLALSGMVGGNQPFHITRTAGFPLITADEFIAGVDA